MKKLWGILVIFLLILVFVGIIFIGNNVYKTNYANNQNIYYNDTKENLSENDLNNIVTSNNIDVENLNLQVQEIPEDKTITITAIGDIMCHNTQFRDAYNNGTYDFSYVFTDIKEYIDNADIAIGNLETTFAGNEVGYDGYPNFNTPEALAYNLKDLGIDVLTTANNHSLDTGYFRT